MAVEKTVLYGENLAVNRPPRPTGGARVTLRGRGGESFGLSDRQFSTHSLLVGSTGCGKTNVQYQIMDQVLPRLPATDVAVVFDPDGTYAQRYYDPGNPRHILFAGGERWRRVTHSWNLFDELRRPDGGLDPDWRLLARELAEAIFCGKENTQQPFFTIAPKDLLCDKLLDTVQLAEATGCKAMLNTKALLDWFKSAQLQDWRDMVQRVRPAHLMYFDTGKAELTAQSLGVFGELNAALSDTFDAFPTQGGRSFSVRQLMEKRGGAVLFLEYDIALGEVQKTLLRLLFDLALKFACGRQQGTTWFFCDELPVLPKLKYLPVACNFGRSHGVRLVCALQSTNQLRDTYGDAADSLLAGFCSLFAFHCYDHATREYLTQRLGRQYTSLAFRAADGRDAVETREGHVLEDWDINALGVGEAVVALAGDDCRPFRFRFAQV